MLVVGVTDSRAGATGNVFCGFELFIPVNITYPAIPPASSNNTTVSIKYVFTIMFHLLFMLGYVLVY